MCGPAMATRPHSGGVQVFLKGRFLGLDLRKKKKTTETEPLIHENIDGSSGDVCVYVCNNIF